MGVAPYLLQECPQPIALDETSPVLALRLIATNNSRAADCRAVHDALRHSLINREERGTP